MAKRKIIVGGIETEIDETIDTLQERIDALQERLELISEDGATWTPTEKSQVTQELADLKATLTTISEQLPSIPALQEQLTQMRQELVATQEQLRTISPPPLEPPNPLPEPPAPDPVVGNTPVVRNNRTRTVKYL